MQALNETTIHCPYCGEALSILVDHSVPDQEYIEDCQVCCRPMVIHALVDVDGESEVRVRSEND